MEKKWSGIIVQDDDREKKISWRQLQVFPSIYRAYYVDELFWTEYVRGSIPNYCDGGKAARVCPDNFDWNVLLFYWR